MNLHFITSLSGEYWNSTGKYCIDTWDLPGKVTIYVDQLYGDLDWLSEVKYHKEAIYVPPLMELQQEETSKIRKFWGKTCAQVHAVTNSSPDERIIWLDADVEQLDKADPSLFNFDFVEPFALMNSGDGHDCWETGLVIFNQQHEKLNVAMKKYSKAWNDPEIINYLWKPYDAQVLGYIAKSRKFYNLCNAKCSNSLALENTRFKNIFKHWINKENKALLYNLKNNEDSNNIS